MRSPIARRHPTRFRSIINISLTIIISIRYSLRNIPSSTCPVPNSHSPDLRSPSWKTLPLRLWSRSQAQVSSSCLSRTGPLADPIPRRRVLRVPPPVVHGWPPFPRDTDYTTLACYLSCPGTAPPSIAKTTKTAKTPVCNQNRRGTQSRRR